MRSPFMADVSNDNGQNCIRAHGEECRSTTTRRAIRTIHAGVLDPESAYETGLRVRVSRVMAVGRRLRGAM